MKYLLLIITSLLICMPDLQAQITGEVNYEQAGIAFTIPDGWFGQEAENLMVLGNNSLPGFMIITSHAYSMDEIRDEMKKGYSEGNGTQLQLSSPLENINEQLIGGEYTGTIEGNAAKAYVIASVNPHDGAGLTIMAATLSNLYSSEYETVAKKLASTIKYTKIDRSTELEEWKTFLSDVRLTYMNSYYSSGYVDGDASVGYSSETKIDLCSAGYFNFNSNSNLTVSGDGVSGIDDDGSRGAGSWSIKIGASGQPTLTLNFRDGSRNEYRLEYTDSKVYLNGTRYFRTTEGEYAPNCH